MTKDLYGERCDFERYMPPETLNSLEPFDKRMVEDIRRYFYHQQKEAILHGLKSRDIGRELNALHQEGKVCFYSPLQIDDLFRNVGYSIPRTEVRRMEEVIVSTVLRNSEQISSLCIDLKEKTEDNIPPIMMVFPRQIYTPEGNYEEFNLGNAYFLLRKLCRLTMGDFVLNGSTFREYQNSLHLWSSNVIYHTRSLSVEDQETYVKSQWSDVYTPYLDQSVFIALGIHRALGGQDLPDQTYLSTMNRDTNGLNYNLFSHIPEYGLKIGVGLGNQNDLRRGMGVSLKLPGNPPKSPNQWNYSLLGL